MGVEKLILLVEDNPDDVELTLRALKASNVANRVMVARDGVEALDLLLTAGKLPRVPELVLLDLKLPRLDGLEVLRRMRADARTRLLPVVVLTSSTEEEDMVKSYSLGANSYVRKPVNFAEFANAVHQLGLYWLVLNLAPPPAAAHA